MKKWPLLIASCVLIFLFGNVAQAAGFPEPKGFINDFAGILSSEQRDSLELELKNFEKETSNEISVAIVQSLEGMDSFTYSQKLFTKWKIGKAGKNNGILFLIAPSERDAFINVGKGLEGAMPDSLTGSILRNEVFPAFKENRYFDGVNNGLTALIQATKGEYVADTGDSESSSVFSMLPMNFIIPFGFFIITYFCSFLARTKSWWIGGVIGTIMGSLAGMAFFAVAGVIASGLAVGVLGLILDYVLSKNYAARKEKGLPTDFWHSGGGFWFGGGRGGFGGGSGGFGGFGGGMSGGGGAGGKW